MTTINQQLQHILYNQAVQDDKLEAIINALDVDPEEPMNFFALAPRNEGDPSMARFRPPIARYKAYSRLSGRVGVPGANVIQPFSWDPAADGNVTQGYHLTVQNPDGSPNAEYDVPLGTSFEITMMDDTQVFQALLYALAADGTAGTPAVTSFTPHTEPIPPPPVPGTPTNFVAGAPRPA